MQEIRDSGKQRDELRIAVMAALNITHELLSRNNNNNTAETKADERIQKLQIKITETLTEQEDFALE